MEYLKSLLMTYSKIYSCNKMVVRLLEMGLNLKIFHDRKDFKSRRVIRSARRFLLVHSIQGSVERSRRAVMRWRLPMMWTNPTYFKRKLLYTWSNYCSIILPSSYSCGRNTKFMIHFILVLFHRLLFIVFVTGVNVTLDVLWVSNLVDNHLHSVENVIANAKWVNLMYWLAYSSVGTSFRTTQICIS